MSLGILEVAIVVAAFLTIGCVSCFRRQWLVEHRWVISVPFLALTAALTTPADPVSTLIVGVPHIILFAVLLRWFPMKRPAA